LFQLIEVCMRPFLSTTCLIALSLLLNTALSLPAAAGEVQRGTSPTVKPAGVLVAEAQTGRKAGDATRPRVGLALGGGGTRGAAHVAVLKVLKREGIPIDCVAGTSIGSVVGGLYCAGMPLDDLEKQFTDMSLMRSFMTVPLWVRVAVAPVMVIPRLWSHPYDGLYKGNKFRKFLENNVSQHSKKNIEDLKVPYSAVAVSLVDGYAHRISKGSLGYAMQASCSVPGLRKPVQIGNDLFCDGGVVANVPVKLCREMGADIVIAVDIDERMLPVPLDNFRKMGSVSERLIKFQLRNIDEPELALADIVIHPNVDGIGLISTKKEDGVKGLKAGEEAANAAIPAIKKKLADAGIGLAGVARTQ
jgi:NTE family protein